MADDVWCIYELIFADGVETIDLHVALKQRVWLCCIKFFCCIFSEHFFFKVH